MKQVVIIGGGAAGFFSAIRIAEHARDQNKQVNILLFEKQQNCLQKVKISGGGRCNITHDSDDIDFLSAAYPRGSRQMKRLLYNWLPSSMMYWLLGHGLETHTEEDGRMFPITNSSQSVLDLFHSLAKEYQIEVKTSSSAHLNLNHDGMIELTVNNQPIHYDKLILASGSTPSVQKEMKHLGLNLIGQVPSLFSIKLKDNPFVEFSGISLAHVEVSCHKSILTSGPMLFTHQGISGPAALKQSAFGARIMAEKNYRLSLKLDFLPQLSFKDLEHAIFHSDQKEKALKHLPVFQVFPKRIREFLFSTIQGISEMKVKAIGNQHIQKIGMRFKQFEVSMVGKNTNKDEFVTAGGIDWKEINISSMELKKFPNVYVAGELIDVDAITGGFNFQAAWVTAETAALDISANI